MATLFGVDIRAVVGSALAGQLPAVMLHHLSKTVAADGSTTTVATNYPAQGVLGEYDDRVKVARGYPMNTARLSIPQAGLAVEPSNGDHVTTAGKRWRVLAVEQDPGNAMWALAVVPA